MTLPPKRGVGGCSDCCFGGGSTDSGGCSCHWIRRVTQKALGITHLDPTPAVSPNRVRCLRFLAVPGGAERGRLVGLLVSVAVAAGMRKAYKKEIKR